MYTLKQLPEDFIVREVSPVKPKPSGKYLYLKLTKKNWNTLDAVKKIAAILNIPEKKIGFAGTKDRNAITEQVISVEFGDKRKIAAIQIQDISLAVLGHGDEPISLGDLQGNEFEIVVRNLESDVAIKPITQTENYFDEQRFGKYNAVIGKHILKKEFAEACRLIDNHLVQKHLLEHPHDYVGAMKRLPVRLLRMYVNAFQSLLWNETVAEFLKQKYSLYREVPYNQGSFVFVDGVVPGVQVPLLGFTGWDNNDEKVKGILQSLMHKYALEPSDFIIRQIPELSMEGGMRVVAVKVENLMIGNAEQDELNQGKWKVKLSFQLGKGSYATMVVRKMFS